jgi:hypothetical protein
MLTASQSWAEGGVVSLVLPTGTFTDPQGEALTYKVTQADAAALPSWLQFNAATHTFSGTAPSAAEVLGLKVTATDTSNLSVYEVFSATISQGTAGLVVGDWHGAGVDAHFGAGPQAADSGGGRLGNFGIENQVSALLPVMHHHF